MLSIRLTRDESTTARSPNRRAQSLLDLALKDPPHQPGAPGDEAEEFARFLASTLHSATPPLEGSPLAYQHYELTLTPAGVPWVLGRGAMGITYKARDLNLHCEVALKVINPRYLAEPGARERFLREARAAAGLRHPHIASIFHLGFRGEEAFYAMEYIVGETLADRVNRQGPFDPASALDIAAQVALALAAAHHRGFLHRDIKPANLMLVSREENRSTQPVIKVIDFGLVKGIAEADTTGDHAFTGSYFIGTPVYASPEQLAHRPLDPRTDLYSLGATLLHLLTGATAEANPRLPDACRELPPPVVDLLDALLQKDMAARPPDAAAALKLIEDCRAGLERTSAPISRVPGDRRSARGQSLRRYTREFICLGVALLGVVIFIGTRLLPGKSFKAERIAVLPFVSHGDNVGLATNLTNDLRLSLAKPPAFEAVALSPGTYRQDRQGSLTDSSPLPRPVRWLFSGSVESQGDLLKVEVRLAESRTRRVVWSDVCQYSLRVCSTESARADATRKIMTDLAASTFRGSKRFSTGQGISLEASTELARAEVYYQAVTRQDNQFAIECCKRALTLAPNFVKAHALLARAYCQRHLQYGEPPDWLPLAQAGADRAIQLAPSSPEGHNALAYIDFALGKQWEALAEDRRAIAAAPGYWLALREYGTSWIGLGHPERAIPWLKAAIDIEPNKVGGYCYLASAYSDLCEDDLAEQCAQLAMRIDSTIQKPTDLLVRLDMLRGRWAEARLLCQKALISRPKSRALLILQAQLDLIEGNNSEAERAFRTLIANDSNGGALYYGSMSYLSALGFLRWKQGHQIEGERLLQQAADLDLHAEPGSPPYLYDLAAIRTIQGRNQEALTTLRKSLAVGWLDFRSLKIDPRFEGIRSSAEFQRILAEMEAKVTRMQQEARRAELARVRLEDDPTGPDEGAR